MRAAELRDLEGRVGARLRASGQRLTRGRREILRALADARRPLTIPEILRARRGLAQSSAYRNLRVLERARAVRRVVTPGDHARYELAEDLSGHHHHLICASCGAVEDFSASSRLERRVQEAMEEVAERAGFAARGHSLDLIGLCQRCA